MPVTPFTYNDKHERVPLMDTRKTKKNIKEK